MAEAQQRNPNEAPHTAQTKKRKGLLSKFFSRSSNADEKKDEKKGGIMDTINQAAAKGVASIAEHEVTKKVERMIDNNQNGSQSTPSNATPDASNTSPSDATNASTSWAKKVVGTAQQKMQSLQGSLGA